MVSEGIGKIVKIGSAKTRYVTIPSNVATDIIFPFSDSEDVRVRIEADKLIVEKIKRP